MSSSPSREGAVDQSRDVNTHLVGEQRVVLGNGGGDDPVYVGRGHIVLCRMYVGHILGDEQMLTGHCAECFQFIAPADLTIQAVAIKSSGARPLDIE